MTILHDECRPTQSTPSDAVVELMARGMAAAIFPQTASSLPSPYDALPKQNQRRLMDASRAILSALSDAGLAVLPLEAHTEMVEQFGDLGSQKYYLDQTVAIGVWRLMVDAFHPSQLEKTDE